MYLENSTEEFYFFQKLLLDRFYTSHKQIYVYYWSISSNRISRKEFFFVHFPFRSPSHEVGEPRRTHLPVVRWHTKPLQQDFLQKPRHLLPNRAQPNNLNSSIVIQIFIDYENTFSHDEAIHRNFLLELKHNLQ